MDGSEATKATGSWVWRAYLALGIILALVYTLLPDRPPFPHAGFQVVGVVSSLAVLGGILVNRPGRAWPWCLLLANLVLFTSGDAIWNYYELVLEIETPFPAVPDAVYIGGYFAMIASMALFIRSRRSGPDAGSMIDATIIATGVGVVSWIYFMEPYANDPSMTLFSRLVSVAYPLMDVLALALVARLLLAPGKRPVSFYLLSVGLLLQLVTDTAYVTLVLNGKYFTGHPIDIGWIGFYTLVGLAALHPSMRGLSDPDPRWQAKLTGWRIGLLAVASLLAPGVLAVQYLSGEGVGESVNVPVIAGASALLFMLVLARVVGLVRKHERAVVREKTLRRSGAALVGALDREGTYSAALDAAIELLRSTPEVRVGLALGSEVGMTVVASAGLRAPEIEGQPFDVEALPTPLRQRFLGNRSVEMREGVTSDAALEDVRAFPERRSFFAIPLFVQGKLRGMMGVTSGASLSEEVKDGLEALGAQVALALESASLREDLHERRSEARFRSLVQNSSDMILILDTEGVARYVSPSYERVLGHKPEDVLGTDGSRILHPDDNERVREFIARVLEKPGLHPPMRIRVRHEDGSWRHLESTLNNLIDDPNVRGIVVNSRDVTERKEIEEQLTHQAFHDALTGLPNRALFMDRLEHTLARAERSSRAAAVLFLDLDRFKVVNDSLGHEIGDKLLLAVGVRLQNCLRPEDTVARIGGDEFAILLEDVPDADYAVQTASRITAALEAPFFVEGKEMVVTTSIGIVLGSSTADDPSDLLRDADLAMYRAKDRGKARYELFDPSMNAHALHRLELENQLRRAVERGELRVYYQPKVDLASGNIAGTEALVRWEHPERGLVSPAEFIPLAEETGLILPLGKWVLGEACRQAKEWQGRKPGASQAISVNLSARQFQQKNLVEEISEVLRETGLQPSCLIVEITESVLMEDAAANGATLLKLKDLGVRVAIDDFGTGYSSLSYLKRFPVDVLKIDRSFVRGLGEDAGAGAIVQAVIDLGDALGLELVAEGIETAEHAELLRKMGCHIGQGFYFAKPLPAAQAAEKLLLAPPLMTAPDAP